VDRLVEILALGVVGHLQPFQCRLCADAQRCGHGHPLSVEHLQHPGDRRCHSLDVKLVVTVGRLDTPRVQQREGRVKDRTHVVEPGAQHIDPVDVLRIGRRQRLQDFCRACGWQGRQGHRLLDAEDACLGRTIGAAGIDECAGFGDRYIGRAAVIVQYLVELDRAQGAAGMQHDDLPVAPVRCGDPGDLGMGRRGHDHMHHMGFCQRFGHVRSYVCQPAEAARAAIVALQVNPATGLDCRYAFGGAVEQGDTESHQRQVSCHRLAAVARADDGQILSQGHRMTPLSGG